MVLVGSSPQKWGSRGHNWPVALAEARADRDSSRVYFPQTPSIFSYLKLKAVISSGFLGLGLDELNRAIKTSTALSSRSFSEAKLAKLLGVAKALKTSELDEDIFIYRIKHS